MHRNLIKSAVVASLMAYSGAAFAGIAGTAHDFSASGWAAGEICIACHTPHNANTDLASVPLWNHDTTTATFTTYTSPTFDGSTTIGQPGESSKACLSCHDGTVALDSYGGATGTTFISGDAALSSDLSNDHPIGFTYDATLVTADGELFATTTSSGISGTIADDMLFSGKMECASCHDVHSDTYAFFLIKDNAASALCLTCHDK